MSNNNTPKRIDLDDLSVLVHHARNYQEYLEEENRRIAQLEEEKDTRVIELADELEETQEARDELKAQLADQATVPRVITADELESWQCVAVGHNGHWRIIETGDHIEEMDRAGILDHFSIYPGDTIVLLEDAPAEEPGPVKVGDTIDAEQVGSLPKGAVLLNVGGVVWERGIPLWSRPGDPARYNTSEVRIHAPFTVLYLPEEDA